MLHTQDDTVFGTQNSVIHYLNDSISQATPFSMHDCFWGCVSKWEVLGIMFCRATKLCYSPTLVPATVKMRSSCSVGFCNPDSAIYRWQYIVGVSIIWLDLNFVTTPQPIYNIKLGVAWGQGYIKVRERKIVHVSSPNSCWFDTVSLGD